MYRISSSLYSNFRFIGIFSCTNLLTPFLGFLRPISSRRFPMSFTKSLSLSCYCKDQLPSALCTSSEIYSCQKLFFILMRNYFLSKNKQDLKSGEFLIEIKSSQKQNSYDLYYIFVFSSVIIKGTIELCALNSS